MEIKSSTKKSIKIKYIHTLRELRGIFLKVPWFGRKKYVHFVWAGY